MKSFLLLLAACIFVYFAQDHLKPLISKVSLSSKSNDEVTQTSSHFSSGSQASGRGKVIRILPDDNKGSRHQKFIIRLSSGRTLLIAHNIDIAPRISSLRVGDSISFNGVYESNSKGGVIHWTHHDPRGRHTNGWLEKGGRKYQ